jgi:hypothetical protein
MMQLVALSNHAACIRSSPSFMIGAPAHWMSDMRDYKPQKTLNLSPSTKNKVISFEALASVVLPPGTTIILFLPVVHPAYRVSGTFNKVGT